MKTAIQIRKHFTPGMFSKETTSTEDPRNKTGTLKTSVNTNQSQELSNCNFKVAIRIRPPLEREITQGIPFQSSVLNKNKIEF